jgi:hypothetical protein
LTADQTARTPRKNPTMLMVAKISVAGVKGPASAATTARVTAEVAAAARPLTPAASAVRSGATWPQGR